MNARPAAAIVVFVAIMLAIGFSAAFVSPPGAWYAGLQKPAFNPPNWVFAPAWTALYVLIGLAGGLAWRSTRRGPLTALWLAQAVLNGAWSLVFFRWHMVDAALGVVVALEFVIFGFVFLAWRPARVAALAFMPYACWVAFAALLNLEILRLN